jgi:hypothetical protein
VSTLPPNRKDLMDAARAAIDAERTKQVEARRDAARAPKGPPSWRLPALVVACVAAGAFFWSEWSRGRPLDPVTLPPAVRSTNARGVMGVMAGRLHRYRAAKGEYPARLQDLGPPTPAFLVYVRPSPGRFELRAPSAGNLTITSEDSVAAFLRGMDPRLLRP